MERFFEGLHEKVQENCVALCCVSLAGRSSQSGFEAGYSGLLGVAVFGCSACVHSPDVPSVCSLIDAEWNSQIQKHAVVVNPVEDVQGCLVHA